jgi:beta-N-acetylhexosaminidase
MGCCGKHFPGHGWVAADSHLAIPVDDRSLADMAPDLEPYRRLRLDGVMPAHVIYPQVDHRPAGFSPVWLEKLREEFNFDGVIFSDDLSMEGAAFAGDMVQRAEAAWGAGCDMLLICNAPEAVAQVLENWKPATDPVRAARVGRLLPARTWQQDAVRYAAGQAAVESLTA